MKVKVLEASFLLRALSSSKAPGRVPDPLPHQARWLAVCLGLGLGHQVGWTSWDSGWQAEALGASASAETVRSLCSLAQLSLCPDTGQGTSRRAGRLNAQKSAWKTEIKQEPSYTTALQTRDSHSCTDTRGTRGPTRDPWPAGESGAGTGPNPGQCRSCWHRGSAPPRRGWSHHAAGPWLLTKQYCSE